MPFGPCRWYPCGGCRAISITSPSSTRRRYDAMCERDRIRKKYTAAVSGDGRGSRRARGTPRSNGKTVGRPRMGGARQPVRSGRTAQGLRAPRPIPVRFTAWCTRFVEILYTAAAAAAAYTSRTKTVHTVTRVTGTRRGISAYVLPSLRRPYTHPPYLYYLTIMIIIIVITLRAYNIHIYIYAHTHTYIHITSHYILLSRYTTTIGFRTLYTFNNYIILSAVYV